MDKNLIQNRWRLNRFTGFFALTPGLKNNFALKKRYRNIAIRLWEQVNHTSSQLRKTE